MADDISVRIGVYGGDDIAKVARQFDKLDNDIKKISQAFDKGRLTSQAYFKGINQQISAMTRLGVGYKDAQRYVWSLSKELREADAAQEQLIESTNRLAKAQTRAQSASAQFAQTSRKGMRNMELVAQQAGYQVGDLAVQIQGGTNAAVAFGQQGSQLLGFFGPAGALAGAALAITTAFIAPFIQAKEAAEDFYSLIEQKLVKLEMLRAGFEDKEALENYQAILAKRQRIADVEKRLQDNPTEERKRLAEITLAQLREELAQLEEQAQAYSDINMALAASEQLSQQLTQAAEDAAEAKKEEADALAEQLRLQQEVHQAAMGNTYEQRQQRTEAQKLLADAIAVFNQRKELLEVSQQETREMSQQTSLLRAELKYGKDSARYRIIQAGHIKANLRWELERAGVEESIIEAMIQEALVRQNMLNDQADLTAEAEAMQAALDASASAMEKMQSFGLNLYQQLALAKVEAEAIATGLDVASAKKSETLRQTALANYLEASGAAQAAMDLDAMERAQSLYDEQLAIIEELDALGQANAAARGSGKSKTTKETVEERLGALIKTADFERTLIGVEEERATQLRRTQELTDMVRDSEGGLTDKRQEMIDQIVEMEASTRKLIEAEDQRQRNIDMFTGHLENAFMSIVDGSATVEDAFKGLMRAILMEIYQQQVAKPVASFFGNMLFPGGGGGLGSLLGNANGNAFLGGRVTPFAMGGVVNSPTFFPMANGTGLMGEAGPEAIMPLKRGPDGKLGVSGGGQTVINQTINVSTGVQQTVRNEIKSMMPQIAEQSKNAVLDAKRRGGSYGKRF